MKILTLTQPWATLVAIGAKRIETRSWSTTYRGPLAIHAGAGLRPVGGEQGLHDLVFSPPFYAALEPAIMVVRHRRLRDGTIEEWPEFGSEALPRGVIVAVCELVDCRPTGADVREYGVHLDTHDAIWVLTDQERAFGDYSSGRYAWLLDNVRPLREPLPYRGAQGLRDLDDATADDVMQRAAQ